jgi:hypothetical protein
LFSAPIAIITGGIGCLVSVAAIALRWPQLARYDNEDRLVGTGMKAQGSGAKLGT